MKRRRIAQCVEQAPHICSLTPPAALAEYNSPFSKTESWQKYLEKKRRKEKKDLSHEDLKSTIRHKILMAENMIFFSTDFCCGDLKLLITLFLTPSPPDRKGSFSRAVLTSEAQSPTQPTPRRRTFLHAIDKRTLHNKLLVEPNRGQKG